MEMAKPKGMFLRGSMWWARKDVPKPLVEIIGKTSLQRTLGTSDLAIATVRFHAVMGQFEAIIADAWRTLRQEPKPPEAEKPVTFEVQMPEWFQGSMPDLRSSDQKIADMLRKANLLPEAKPPVALKAIFEAWKKAKGPPRTAPLSMSAPSTYSWRSAVPTQWLSTPRTTPSSGKIMSSRCPIWRTRPGRSGSDRSELCSGSLIATIT